jgi:glycyl-tRNA synthetase beta subunit
MTNTSERSISNQVEAQSQVDERLRQAILDKKHAQIEAWSQQIEHLQQVLHSVSSELRVETEKRVIELSDARDQAFAQVERLKLASQENWDTLLMQTDHLFQDLATRFHELVDRGN